MDGSAKQPIDLMLHWDGGAKKRLRKYSSPRVDSERCVNCGSCLAACPTGALREMQRQICRLCPDCAQSQAMLPSDMVELTSRSCAAACPLGHFPEGYVNMVLGKNYAAGALLVGDAGSFVEPFILEGVASAVRSANYAVRTTLQALEENDFREAFLSGYDEKWREKLGPQLSALQGMAVTAADAPALNKVFGELKNNPEAVARVFAE
jgi:ferredoxin